MIKMLFSRAKAGMVLAAFLLSVSLLPVGQASSGSAPILLVTNGSYSGDPFGSYLGEILRAEGLNEFDTADLSVVTGSQLAQYPVVVLAETPLSSAQASLFSAYVSNGGGLVAMRPDGQIASLFGLGGLAGTQTDGYMAIDGAAQVNGEGVGQGLVTETLQVHGVSDLRPAQGGAVVVAWLYTGNNTATGYPAVVSAGYGSGRGVAFSYDLGESVVYTRQGNPSTASYVNPQTGIAGDVDGDGVYRTIDLFQKVGGGAGWVDLNKVPIPQADMQMRLFARLVRNLAGHSAVQGLPLPQLWYFPGTARTVLVATGDAHANPESYFQYEVASILKHHGVLTFYPAIGSTPTVTDVQSWLGQGFSFGIHPYWNRPDNYPPYSSSNLQQGYAAAYNWFTTTYGPYNIPMSATVRNHQVAWAGWTDSADYAASYGIGMDTSFYDWGTWLKKADGSWANGYITGSGLPMKFARSDGTLTTVYQQLTELVDEQLVLGTDTAVEGLTGSQAVQVSQQMIDASQGGYYSALVTQFHVDYYENGDPQVFAEGTLDYAYNNGVPILNADQWLGFTQTRHDANYSNVSWNNATGTLSFNLNAAASGYNLTTVLPLTYNGLNLTSVTVDGVPTAVRQQTINGVNTGFIVTSAGNHSFVAVYTTTPLPTPTPTLITPTPTTAPGTPTPTPTSSVGQPTPTPTQNTSPNVLTQTSYVDFGQSCAVASGAHVSTAGGGAVELAAVEADDFNEASLDTSKWSSGDWSGGAYTPTLSNSVMSIMTANGGWVRSVPTYTHGVMEVVAQFGAAGYQHIGFASDGFSGNRYFIFSTYQGNGDLYARVNNNVAEQNVDLGPLPSGMHRYRIEWSVFNSSTDQVAFYLDGSQVAVFTVTNVGASNFYLYMSNASSTVPLLVDYAQATPPYVGSGTYTSCSLDAGSGNSWQSIAWDASVPANTGLTVQVQTSADGVSWSGWSTVTNSAGSAVPAGRYLQYQLSFSTSDTLYSPLVNSITLTDSGAVPQQPNGTTPTPTPTPTNTQPSPSATPTNTTQPLTPTPTQTPTGTSIPPTATPTNTPIPPSPTPTNTPLPPTATPTSTLLAPTNTPTATPTNTLAPAFPSTGLLDNFNRANGGLGSNWSGQVNGYSIVSSALDVGKGGNIFWKPTSYSPNQEVYVQLTNIDPSASEIDLLLKAQSNKSYGSGVIEVLYNPSSKQVQVWTYTNSQGWVQRGVSIPVTFVNGDQFGARATSSGQVSVYRNGVLLGTSNVTAWPNYAMGGYVGLWFVNAPNMVVDNFGGGS
jgi:hypothetical protein